MIKKLREDIDKIDHEIIQLLRKRLEMGWKIQEIKKKNNLCLIDKSREKEIINRLSNDLDKELVQRIYKPIFEKIRGKNNVKKICSTAI